MNAILKLVSSFTKGPGDIVGLDVAVEGVKAVRLKRKQESIHLLAADILPGIDLNQSANVNSPSLQLPKPLCGRYAALAVAAPEAVVKLLNMPGRFSETDEQNLLANLGLEHEDSHRISYSIVAGGHQRHETRVLAAALPEPTARTALELLPKGRPAPYSLELSGLAALAGFTYALGDALADKTVGVLDGGEIQTTFAVFHKGTPSLVRQFDFGSQKIIAKTGEKLGLDAGAAAGLITDGSFDVSSILHQILEPFFKQIIISKEFVERRENCHLSEILFSGNLSAVRGTDEAIKGLLGADVRKWNPFNGLIVADGALPEALAGQEARFAAAFGAAMSVVTGAGS